MKHLIIFVSINKELEEINAFIELKCSDVPLVYDSKRLYLIIK